MKNGELFGFFYYLIDLLYINLFDESYEQRYIICSRSWVYYLWRLGLWAYF